MACVVDNSVIVGWFVESQANAYTRRARRHAERAGMIAPQLWPVEFASVLRGLERRGLLTPHNVDRISGSVMALEIALDPSAPPQQLIALSRRLEISCYDAAYLEVAARRGVALATRDGALARAARSAGALWS